MLLVFIVIYVTFCLLVAYAGRRATLGFIGVFFVSILLTPLISAILLVLFRTRIQKKK